MKTNLNLKNQQIPVTILKTNLALNTKVVSLSLAELKDFYATKIAENPLIEEKERFEENDLEKANKNEIFKDEDKKNQFLKDIEIETSNSYYLKSPHSKTPHDLMEVTLKNRFSLYDDLHQQLAFVYNEDSLEYEIGSYLIDCIDENGFISQEEFSLSKVKFGSKAEVVWDKLKTFTPPGIAAKNLQECLLIQLSSGKENRIEKRMIKSFFPLFLKKDFAALAKKMNLSIEKIKKAFEKITFLEFYPKRNYSNETLYIQPDVRVVEEDGKLILIVNDEEIPKIFYNRQYLSLMKNKKSLQSQEFTNFLNEKKFEAQSLLFALKYRNLTLIKMMSYLLFKQKVFFLQGKKYLIPDTLTNASKELEIEISTLSRLVNKKYVDTKWGIFPLKYFFSSSLLKGKKQEISSEKIKITIKEMIENSMVKLSDQKITDILKNKGLNISRRTVAKYRNEMKILSSYDRK